MGNGQRQLGRAPERTAGIDGNQSGLYLPPPVDPLAIEFGRKPGTVPVPRYRLAVLPRGDTVITDAHGATGGITGVLARVVMGVFHWLFHLNLPATPFGWQIIARVHLPH